MIIFREGFYSEDLFETLRADAPWVNRNAPRDECFMALFESVYSYGKRENARSYNSVPMHPKVLELMSKINREYESYYNIVVLNYYKSEKEHLGWHADDSPEQDLTHPIAVVSFGATRYIYTKKKEYKGIIPDSDKFLLTPGSLFIMPGGFQDNHFHKIPKHDQPCGGRISLTFRKLG